MSNPQDGSQKPAQQPLPQSDPKVPQKPGPQPVRQTPGANLPPIPARSSSPPGLPPPPLSQPKPEGQLVSMPAKPIRQSEVQEPTSTNWSDSLKNLWNSNTGENLFFVMVGFISILVIIALIVAVVPALLNGITILLGFDKLLFIILVCIGGGIFVGFLWGRFGLSQPNAASNSEGVQLTMEEKLQGQAQAKPSSPAVPTAASSTLQENAQQGAPASTPQPTSIPVQTQVEPSPRFPSIYDTAEIDPPDYDEKTTKHPHHKIFPASEGDNPNLSHDWKLIGASRRGYGHAYKGKYREDDFSISGSGLRSSHLDVALVAIADGVSAKEYSRLGALAAVEGATKVPASRLQELAQLGDSCEGLACTILMEALQAAHENVKACANKERLNIDDLHSTLMVFLTIPLEKRRLFVASVQIGDGVLFALQNNKSRNPRDRWRWLQPPQIQESGNEVQPFMRTDSRMWKQYLQCDVLDDAIFIMGMTDGTADDMEPPRATLEEKDPDPFVHVDEFYQFVKANVLGKAEPAKALDDFLGYKKKQSYDDRTVVCVYSQK